MQYYQYDNVQLIDIKLIWSLIDCFIEVTGKLIIKEYHLELYDSKMIFVFFPCHGFFFIYYK